MSALNRLAGLLLKGAGVGDRAIPAESSLDAIIAQLKKHTNAGGTTSIPGDLQEQAVRRFWDVQRFDNLREARLVSFCMCIPSRPAGPCIMEDRRRFQAVLDRQTGVDQWLDDPKWYRRCYQGLVRSYFTYDPKGETASAVGRQNWGDLRDYLHDRTHNIVDKKVNPEWVTTAVSNQNVFSEDPCEHSAEVLLQGDSSAINHLCEQLGIIKASWFLKELVLAQVRQATKLSHEHFCELIPFLLNLLTNNQMLRDRGLILMLDRYASADQPGINEPLRNASVDWWGNPWLPSNEMRWGGVETAARQMVSEWLRREFIEAFFTKLAEDGVGDRRRANFWLRYVKSMNNVQFALGARALHSPDRDFVALRKKMKGLYTELRTTDSSNNAFVMTMGNLVAVEFGGMGNAFYGYDVRKTLPFDVSLPVNIAVDSRNSLKHKNRILWMQHQDGIKGWSRWEQMFEATLKKYFDIKPNADTLKQSPPTASQARTAAATQVAPAQYTHFLLALYVFAKAHQLKVEDFSSDGRGGNLWVRTNDDDLSVNKALLDWKFNYKPGKGWWR